MANIVADIEGSSVTTYLRGVNLIAYVKGSTKNYYLYNAHGDVVYCGSKAYRYDAFGNELAPATNDSNPFRYAGEYFDGETGTYYLRARYYDPSNGRFSSEDPIRDGLNFYTYGNGNPIFFIDPTGLAAVELRGWFNEKYGYIKEFYDDVSGVLAWNDATKTAFIRMEANGYSGYAEFTVGLNGTYIDPKTNRMYVDSGLLWQIFGRVIDPPLEHDYVGDAIVFAGGLFIAGALEFGGGAAAIGEAVKSGAAKAAAGAAASGALATSEISRMLSNVIPNSQHHIMQIKHAWDLVRANNWSSVSDVIRTVLTNGTSVANNDAGNVIYSYVYSGQTVEVTTRVVDGVIRIVDAWVKTR